MTLFDCNQLAHVIVLWQIKQLFVTVPFFLCFILYLRAISKYKPSEALIWRGDLSEVFLRYELGGLIFEGLIHGGAYFWKIMVFEGISIISRPELRLS